MTIEFPLSTFVIHCLLFCMRVKVGRLH